MSTSPSSLPEPSGKSPDWVNPGLASHAIPKQLSPWNWVIGWTSLGSSKTPPSPVPQHTRGAKSTLMAGVRAVGGAGRQTTACLPHPLFGTPLFLVESEYQKVLQYLIEMLEKKGILQHLGDGTYSEQALADLIRNGLKTASGDSLRLLYVNPISNLHSVDVIAVNTKTGEVFVFDAKNWSGVKGLPSAELEALREANLKRRVIQDRVTEALKKDKKLLKGMSRQAVKDMMRNLQIGKFTKVVSVDGLITRIPSKKLKQGYILHRMNRPALRSMKRIIDNILKQPKIWAPRLAARGLQLTKAVQTYLGKLSERLGRIASGSQWIATGISFGIALYICGDVEASADIAAEEAILIRPSELPAVGDAILGELSDIYQEGDTRELRKFIKEHGKNPDSLTWDDLDQLDRSILRTFQGGEALIDEVELRAAAEAFKEYENLLKEMEEELGDLDDEGFTTKDERENAYKTKVAVLDAIASDPNFFALPGERVFSGVQALEYREKLEQVKFNKMMYDEYAAEFGKKKKNTWPPDEEYRYLDNMRELWQQRYNNALEELWDIADR